MRISRQLKPRILLLSALMLTSKLMLPSVVRGNEPVRLGVPETAFQGMDPVDAKLALRGILRMTALGKHSLEVVSFPDRESFGRAVREKEIDLFPISSIECVELEEYVDPVVATVLHGETPLTNLVLLTRKDHPSKEVSDLKGVDLIFHQGPNYSLAEFWLENIVTQSGGENIESFFASRTKAFRPGEVVLPVFFKKIDACVIAKENWEAMAEMNPQLGEHLKVVAESKNVIGNMIAFHRDFEAEGKEEFIQQMLRFHESKAGNQLLTLSRAKRMVAYQTEWLDGVRALVDSSNNQDVESKGGTE